ncbi:MAG: hypothetical protein ACLRNC_13525 [Gemmiger formicilis]|uniref:hypothetical protein n=1 Tax=Gemmiger formicilis TaxID=745368 RepID=UPI003A474166
MTTRENDKDKILAEQSILDGPLILRLIAHRLHMAVYYVVGGSTPAWPMLSTYVPTAQSLREASLDAR